MPGDDLVPRPDRGRRFVAQTIVRLADVSVAGRLRLDAIGRLLQDVSSDDTAAAAQAPAAAWVVRRLTLEFAPGRAPRLRDELTFTTWCSGIGPRWAERRTDMEVGGHIALRAAALWVFIDLDTGRPIPLGPDFESVYAEAAGGRRVPQRLRHESPPVGAIPTAWALRVSDFDVLGHVNNAAYWQPVEDALARLAPGRRVARAEIEFRGGIDPGAAVAVTTVLEPDELRLWLTEDGDVRASVVVGLAPADS